MKHIAPSIRKLTADLEPDEWVNASVTILVPLDVPLDATDTEKRDAMLDVHADVLEALPERFDGCVSSASWEDVRPLGKAA